jgi:catechol 2,3-dioxygenase-like lactoylglutathione lyase family enzyme
MSCQKILAISQTCHDLEAQANWYCQQLGFEQEQIQRLEGPWIAELFGTPELTSLERTALRLGNEQLQLWQWPASREPGEAAALIPTDSRSNDQWFQHICMVTNDLKASYSDELRACSQPISSAPQTLPNWNPGAAGIEAVKFKDPLGHPLELLAFPADKGDPRWHQKTERSAQPMGIDHSAIGIIDTEVSLHFYRDLLGLNVTGTSLNHGREQDGLDGLSGTQVKITSLRPPGQALGIELLNYQQPEGGRQRRGARVTDLCEWRIVMEVGDLKALHEALKRADCVATCGDIVDLDPDFFSKPKGFFVRDPDQHALVLVGE